MAEHGQPAIRGAANAATLAGFGHERSCRPVIVGECAGERRRVAPVGRRNQRSGYRPFAAKATQERRASLLRAGKGRPMTMEAAGRSSPRRGGRCWGGRRCRGGRMVDAAKRRPEGVRDGHGGWRPSAREPEAHAQQEADRASLPIIISASGKEAEIGSMSLLESEAEDASATLACPPRYGAGLLTRFAAAHAPRLALLAAKGGRAMTGREVILRVRRTPLSADVSAPQGRRLGRA